MTFQVPYAFGLLILIIGVASAVTFFAYRKTHFEGIYRFLLPLLRAVGLILVGVLLLKPVVIDRSVMEERPVLIWLQDESSSLIAHEDSASFSDEYYGWLNAAGEELSSRYNVVTYGFDGEVHSLNGAFRGRHSAPGDALEEGRVRAEGRNVAGIILATDGISTRGIPLSDRSVGSLPVHTIALGDSSVYPDVRITEVQNNPVAYIGNTTPIKVQIEGKSWPSSAVTVELWDGKDRISSRDVRLNRGLASASFEVSSDSTGIKNYRLEIPSQTGERNVENNRLYTRIDYLENKRTVDIIYAAPHPDIAALRMPVAEDPSYRVRLYSFGEWNLSESSSSDLLIFHLCKPNAAQWKSLKDQEISVALVTGESSPYSGWRGLDPVFASAPVTDRVSEVTPHRSEGFSAFRMNAEWSEALASFPPLFAGTHSEAESGIWNPALVAHIGRVRTATPVLSVGRNEDQRLGWLNGEGWWRLRSYSYARFFSHEWYDETIRQWYRWLLTRPGADRLEVEHPALINAGEVFDLIARPKDAALQPYAGGDVRLQVRPESSDAFERQLEESVTGQYSTEINGLTEGTYSYTVTATLGDENLVQKGEFIVRNVDIEKRDTRARIGLLHAVSASSDGLGVTYANRDELIASLMAADAPSILHESVQTESLLKKWWPYVLILLIFTAEWVIRKREGQV